MGKKDLENYQAQKVRRDWEENVRKQKWAGPYIMATVENLQQLENGSDEYRKLEKMLKSTILKECNVKQFTERMVTVELDYTTKPEKCVSRIGINSCGTQSKQQMLDLRLSLTESATLERALLKCFKADEK